MIRAAYNQQLHKLFRFQNIFGCIWKNLTNDNVRIDVPSSIFVSDLSRVLSRPWTLQLESVLHNAQARVKNGMGYTQNDDDEARPCVFPHNIISNRIIIIWTTRLLLSNAHRITCQTQQCEKEALNWADFANSFLRWSRMPPQRLDQRLYLQVPFWLFRHRSLLRTLKIFSSRRLEHVHPEVVEEKTIEQINIIERMSLKGENKSNAREKKSYTPEVWEF